MAGIAIGISQEIVLMLRLGLPEVARRSDFGDDFSGPEPGRVDVGDGIRRNPTLRVVGVVDRRSIARPDVVALTVTRGRIVDLKEELENLPKADTCRIEQNLDGFGMRSVIAIGGIGRGTTGVPDTSGDHAVVSTKQILHAPEA